MGKTPSCIVDHHVAVLCCRLVRNILEDKPRVTRFAIEWDPVEQVLSSA